MSGPGQYGQNEERPMTKIMGLSSFWWQRLSPLRQDMVWDGIRYMRSTLAAEGPFSPATMSNFTLSPSFNVLKPSL